MLELKKLFRTYLVFLLNFTVALEVLNELVELDCFIGSNLNVLLCTFQDTGSFSESFIAVWSRVCYNVLLECVESAHVGVHGDDVHQETFWIEVESLWVIDPKLQASFGSQSLEAKVQCVSKALSKLLGDEWLTAMSGDLTQELDDHVTQL